MLTHLHKYISDSAMKQLLSLLARILVYMLRTFLLFVYMWSQLLQSTHHPHIDHKYSCCININYRNQRQWTLFICILDLNCLWTEFLSFLQLCVMISSQGNMLHLNFSMAIYLLREILSFKFILIIYKKSMEMLVCNSPSLLIFSAFKKVLEFSDCSLTDLSGIIILSFKIILWRLWKCLLCKNSGLFYSTKLTRIMKI